MINSLQTSFSVGREEQAAKILNAQNYREGYAKLHDAAFRDGGHNKYVIVNSEGKF